MVEEISAEFPFESQYASVLGSRMHYVTAGEGPPIVLLHGNPTSSYLWRNVIPELAALGRCIAPDLIGFGKSAKPDIPYRVFDHADYIEGFISALGLFKPALVLHDWGGFMGMRYASRHPENVRAIAMMEAVVNPMRMADRSEGFQRAFAMLRSEQGREKVLKDNFFVERILPGSILRKLTEQEMAAYREPFAEPESRLPTWVFPNDIPLDGQPADVHDAVLAQAKAVSHAGIPLLLLGFEPGAITGAAEIEWCRKNYGSLTVQGMGKGIHFVQEDQPRAIGSAIAKWLRGLG